MKNETFEKARETVKDTTQKILNSENTHKVKTTAEDVTAKIKENEKVAKVVDGVNKNKHSKLIKIGLAVLSVILVFNIFSGLFKDKDKAYAVWYSESWVDHWFEESGIGDLKRKTDIDVIGKDKSKNLYVVDIFIKGKSVSGLDAEQKCYLVLYADRKNKKAEDIAVFYYDSTNKIEMKDKALSYLK